MTLQDISTAPRDGTHFISCSFNKYNQYAIDICAWTPWGGGYWHDPKWGSKGIIEPTHWQPLPEPPDDL